MEELFSQMTANQILDWLEAHSDSVDESHYMRPLSSDEQEEYRSAFITESIQLKANEEELAAYVKSFKAQKINGLKEAVNRTRDILKTGKLAQNGRLYTVRDFDTNMLYVYDVNGNEISNRRLLPNERQGVIFKVGKVG